MIKLILICLVQVFFISNMYNLVITIYYSYIYWIKLFYKMPEEHRTTLLCFQIFKKRNEIK